MTIDDVPAGLPHPLRGQRIGQIGIVVGDLEDSLAHYSALLAVDRWTLYDYSAATVPMMRFRGLRATYAMRLALGGSEPQIELIQPVSGPSLYHEWIADRGPGVQHLGMFVNSIDVAVRSMVAAGFDELQFGAGYGLDGDGGFAYFDTTSTLGFIAEAIEVPQRRRIPDATWPRPT